MSFKFHCMVLGLAATAMLNAVPLSAAARSDAKPGTLPITTRSKEARKLFESGLLKLENLHSIEGMQDLRKAAAIDPDFGMAEILLSLESVDPAVDPEERVAWRQKAQAARSKVTSGEQLVIDWMANSSEGKIVPAIQAM